MFSIGFSELILILIIAYVFVGPQDLPKVTRWIARSLKNFRQLISEVKKETGWNEIVNETKDFQRDLKNTITENDRDFQKSLQEISEEVRETNTELNKNIISAKKEIFKN